MDRIIFLVDSVGSTGAGSSQRSKPVDKTFQAYGSTTSGSGSATIDIEVSNNNINWIVAGTITLTLGTTETSDGFAVRASWIYARANVTAISGTGAKVSAVMAL
mgnify:CR=1 FL=1